MRSLILPYVALLSAAEPSPIKLGVIDFFGVQGMDVAAVRAALPFREGDRLPEMDQLEKWRDGALEAVRRTAGSPATDVSMVCCTAKGDWMIYIGLPGRSTRARQLDAPPKGGARLPETIVETYDGMMNANEEAVQRGEKLGDEWASKLGSYAAEHETDLLRVLRSSGEVRHRRAAAMALGYGPVTRAQVAGLARAIRDADNVVRNNAIRALGAMAAAPGVDDWTPAARFLDLLTSGTWTDRNKGLFLFVQLTKTRNSEVLKELRTQALPALIEMARWKSEGHAQPAWILLARIAGINEADIGTETDKTRVEELIRRAQRLE